MIRNEEKFKQAVEFRKRGFTYSEIAKICDVSKSTVSNWLSKKQFSKRVKKDNVAMAARENKKRMGLINKARSAERKSRYEEALRAADTEYKHYKKNPDFVAGLIAYMASGDLSQDAPIRLTTNRSAVHKMFIEFAEQYLGADKKTIRFWVLLPESKKTDVALKWWSRKIGVSIAQFGKTQVVSVSNAPLHNGTGNTIIGSTVLKCKLLRWIALAEKEL